MHSETPLVSVIRRSSRLMVRELGFMASTLASTNYSPSAVPHRNSPTQRDDGESAGAAAGAG